MHPRIGAADVVPFVPVEGVTLEDCVRLANELGQRLWERLRVPVYLYEAAARRPDRTNLENIRRGQFEGLREEVRTNPDRQPDFGEAELHPSAGRHGGGRAQIPDRVQHQPEHVRRGDRQEASPRPSGSPPAASAM